MLHETKPISGSPLTNFQERVSALKDSVDPFVCVAEELELVEENLARSIRSDERGLTEISAHLIEGGGKRIRPMVTLLVFKMFRGQRVTDAVDIA
ncbi:MAG: hypothetical protein ACREQK_05785, partial [Candidatus Binatia bacterium]